MSGLLVTIAALVIEIFCIYFQTDPATSYTEIIGALIVVLLTGAVLLAGAFWEWKHEVSSMLVIILVCIGLVGFGGSASIHNMLVDAFFPRTTISAFLGINFMAVAMFGIFLWVFRRIPRSNDR